MSTDGPDMFDGHIQTLVLYSGTDPVMVFLDGDLVITEHKTKAKLLPTWKLWLSSFRAWNQRRKWTADQREMADRLSESLYDAMFYGDREQQL